MHCSWRRTRSLTCSPTTEIERVDAALRDLRRGLAGGGGAQLSPPSETRTTVRTPPRAGRRAPSSERPIGVRPLPCSASTSRLKRVAVQRADRRDQLRVPAALGARDAASPSRTPAGPPARRPAARDQLAQRRLGGVQPRAPVARVLVHRLRAVEDQEDGAVLAAASWAAAGAATAPRTGPRTAKRPGAEPRDARMLRCRSARGAATPCGGSG